MSRHPPPSPPPSPVPSPELGRDSPSLRRGIPGELHGPRVGRLLLPEKNSGTADFVLVAQDGYAVSATASGDDFVLPVTGSMSQGYHGYLAGNPKMNALFHRAASPGDAQRRFPHPAV